ncbi:MAG: hypothetical protein JWM96_1425 [Alphaproteobacteria bacterium]|nr:hypothetical protein [Alphaproteobacteria bacterium]
MDSMTTQVVTIVVGLIGGYLAQFIQPKSKLIIWSPHNFVFNVRQENESSITLQTNSITLQNVGRLSAEGIEIIYKKRPDFFELYPSREYSEFINSNGEHVIKIDSLGSKEWVVIQLLSYINPPFLSNVRWKNGQAKVVQIQPQIIYPRWLLMILNILVLIGIVSVLYLLGHLFKHLSFKY